MQENEPKEKRNSYQVMTSILKKDFIPTEEEIKSLNSWMITRWLSNHPYGIEIANYINNNHNMPLHAQYWLARNKVFGIKYIPYPKKESDKNEVYEIFSNHYNCRLEIAKEMVSRLPQSEIDKIVNMYKNVGRIK